MPLLGAEVRNESRMNVIGLTAEPVLSDRKENGTAKDAKHAKGSGAERGEDNAFDK